MYTLIIIILILIIVVSAILVYTFFRVKNKKNKNRNTTKILNNNNYNRNSTFNQLNSALTQCHLESNNLSLMIEGLNNDIEKQQTDIDNLNSPGTILQIINLINNVYQRYIHDPIKEYIETLELPNIGDISNTISDYELIIQQMENDKITNKIDTIPLVEQYLLSVSYKYEEFQRKNNSTFLETIINASEFLDDCKYIGNFLLNDFQNVISDTQLGLNMYVGYINEIIETLQPRLNELKQWDTFDNNVIQSKLNSLSYYISQISTN